MNGHEDDRRGQRPAPDGCRLLVLTRNGRACGFPAGPLRAAPDAVRPGHGDAVPMRTSYGVVWREGAKPLARGKLELLARAVRLEGMTGSEPTTREIAYDFLSEVRIGRSPEERIDGRPSLVLAPAERRAARHRERRPVGNRRRDRRAPRGAPARHRRTAPARRRPAAAPRGAGRGARPPRRRPAVRPGGARGSTATSCS